MGGGDRCGDGNNGQSGGGRKARRGTTEEEDLDLDHCRMKIRNVLTQPERIDAAGDLDGNGS